MAPFLNRAAPGAISSPALSTFSPGATGLVTSIVVLSSAEVYSTITTASAPSGSIPPVGTPTALPGSTFTLGGSPMTTSPDVSRRAGRPSDAPKVSRARTAYPSMDARTKFGTGSAAVISKARILPHASVSGIDSDASGSICCKIDKTSSAVLTLRNRAIKFSCIGLVYRQHGFLRVKNPPFLHLKEGKPSLLPSLLLLREDSTNTHGFYE